MQLKKGEELNAIFAIWVSMEINLSAFSPGYRSPRTNFDPNPSLLLRPNDLLRVIPNLAVRERERESGGADARQRCEGSASRCELSSQRRGQQSLSYARAQQSILTLTLHY